MRWISKVRNEDEIGMLRKIGVYNVGCLAPESLTH